MNSDVATRLTGVIVPMVTPFTDSGDIDGDATDRLVDHVIDGGVDGIFVLGTTGESASIGASQKRALVDRTAKRLKQRARLYAGVSSTVLQESIEWASVFESYGVDAVVAHPPGYFQVPPAAIESHMRRLADAVQVPLLLYDIPKVTHCELSIDVILRLAGHPHIVGLKDSTGDAQRVAALIQRLAGRKDFGLHLGSTSLFGAFLRQGGRGISGIVPSSANLDPRLYRELFDASRRGDDLAVETLHDRNQALGGVYQANMTLGESIARLKRELSKLGLCRPNVLLPLVQAEAET